LRHAEPRAERRPVERKGRFAQRLAERRCLEVDGHEGEIARRRDLRSGEPLALKCLGGRVIDLEDTDRARPARLAVGKGVEAGTQDQVLHKPARDGFCQAVLRIAAADQEAGPPLPCEGMAEDRRQPASRRARDIDELRGDRVVEDFRLVVGALVQRAHDGRNVARPARLRLVHA